MLFERAMLWGLIDLQRNPIELITLKGTSRRLKRPHTITAREVSGVDTILEEPYRTMVIVAICTGLRVSEVLALRWEHIDFSAGVILVQQGVVQWANRQSKNRSVLKTKSQSIRRLPSYCWRGWKSRTSGGSYFRPAVTGRSYHAGILQQKILRPKGGKEIGIQKLGWHTIPAQLPLAT